jgi:argonaute-like protein implicated in RNA metabolism and viral defense
MRDWRETRDRMMKAGANSGDILKAIAADKAHNRQVREQLNKIKRDLKKVYKDPAARERAYQRRMDHETRNHEQAEKDWEKGEDRITRDIRNLESKRDEEVAKSVDSELKAQAKEAGARSWAGYHQKKDEQFRFDNPDAAIARLQAAGINVVGEVELATSP